MKRELLSKTNDKVFEEIFTRNKSYMADFLKYILNIPDEEFDDFFRYIQGKVQHLMVSVEIMTKNHSYLKPIAMRFFKKLKSI